MNAGVIVALVTLAVTAPPAYLGVYLAVRKSRAEAAQEVEEKIQRRVAAAMEISDLKALGRISATEISDLKAQMKKREDGGDTQ